MLGVLALGLVCGAGKTQWSSKAPQISPAGQATDPLQKDPLEAHSAEISQRQEKSRNDDRQRRLVADTDKLLTLATELHQDVAKTNKNVLSIDVVKRADEIERLAHGVKERMKG